MDIGDELGRLEAEAGLPVEMRVGSFKERRNAKSRTCTWITRSKDIPFSTRKKAKCLCVSLLNGHAGANRVIISAVVGALETGPYRFLHSFR